MKCLIILVLLFMSIGLNADDVDDGIQAYEQKNFKKAKELFEKACNSGNIKKGCFNLGGMYLSGQGVMQDYLKAFQLYEKVCNDGDALGCHNLGGMYLHGQGVMQDNFKAFHFYEKACNSNTFAFSCNELGLMYDNGKGVKQDSKKALELFGKVCDMKIEDGCKNYAIVKKRLGL